MYGPRTRTKWVGTAGEWGEQCRVEGEKGKEKIGTTVIA